MTDFGNTGNGGNGGSPGFEWEWDGEECLVNGVGIGLLDGVEVCGQSLKERRLDQSMLWCVRCNGLD